MRKLFLKILIHPLALLWSFFFFAHVVHGAELSVITVDSESSLKYQVTVDKVEALAGLKISISYPTALHFQAAEKGKQFKSFLHVVNDKVPGKIILVMASAKGVSGPVLPLFTLDFSPADTAPSDNGSQLQIIGCELMSEELKEIPCTIAATR